ncbi:hypothetical protein, partial [Enterobacter cloacae complex sp. 4DZ3-17B2]|uniref:hypothetical protein n=1 Tax=Enterobacter cloacae complex sp. 4DZ3-17B2 TaxID=2511990 RepID=UPI001CA59D75
KHSGMIYVKIAADNNATFILNNEFLPDIRGRVFVIFCTKVTDSSRSPQFVLRLEMLSDSRNPPE